MKARRNPELKCVRALQKGRQQRGRPVPFPEAWGRKLPAPLCLHVRIYVFMYLRMQTAPNMRRCAWVCIPTLNFTLSMARGFAFRPAACSPLPLRM